MSRTRVLGPALIASTVLLSACGSTAAIDRGARIAAEDGLSATGDGSSSGLPSRDGGSRRTIEARGTRQPGGAGPVGSAGSSAGSRVVPGDGTKELKVGVYYPSDAQESLSAIGAQSTAPDFQAASEVVVRDINARGGIAGRKLVPVYHGFSLQAPDRAAEDQAACDDFTEDRPVIVVIGLVSQTDILAECLAKAGIVYLFTGLSIDSQAVFDRNPLQSEPVSINLDRLARVEVEGLHAQNYLRHAAGSQAAGRGLPVKLGVIAFDTPSFRDVFARVLAPAYKAKGVPVSEVRFVRRDTASLGADIDSAVLAFAQRNVTHVTFLTASGLAPGLFIVRAHSQRYEPRYGFSSQDAPQIVWADNIQKISGDAAKTQYRGAVGVGWLPFGDVANATDPGVAPASYKRCLDMMREGGLPPKDANYNGILTFICDGFWFGDAAFEAGGAARLSQSSFVAGQDSLGDAYLPATISSTRVGPDRRDGVGSVRHFAFFDGCSCFRYTSGKMGI